MPRHFAVGQPHPQESPRRTTRSRWWPAGAAYMRCPEPSITQRSFCQCIHWNTPILATPGYYRTIQSHNGLCTGTRRLWLSLACRDARSTRHWVHVWLASGRMLSLANRPRMRDIAWIQDELQGKAARAQCRRNQWDDADGSERSL